MASTFPASTASKTWMASFALVHAYEPEMGVVCGSNTTEAVLGYTAEAMLLPGTVFCLSDTSTGALVNYYATDAFAEQPCARAPGMRPDTSAWARRCRARMPPPSCALASCFPSSRPAGPTSGRRPAAVVARKWSPSPLPGRWPPPGRAPCATGGSRVPAQTPGRQCSCSTCSIRTAKWSTCCSMALKGCTMPCGKMAPSATPGALLPRMWACQQHALAHAQPVHRLRLGVAAPRPVGTAAGIQRVCGGLGTGRLCL